MCILEILRTHIHVQIQGVKTAANFLAGEGE